VLKSIQKFKVPCKPCLDWSHVLRTPWVASTPWLRKRQQQIQHLHQLKIRLQSSGSYGSTSSTLLNFLFFIYLCTKRFLLNSNKVDSLKIRMELEPSFALVHPKPGPGVRFSIKSPKKLFSHSIV
jgi:hypothetical protein